MCRRGGRAAAGGSGRTRRAGGARGGTFMPTGSPLESFLLLEIIPFAPKDLTTERSAPPQIIRCHRIHPGVLLGMTLIRGDKPAGYIVVLVVERLVLLTKIINFSAESLVLLLKFVVVYRLFYNRCNSCGCRACYRHYPVLVTVPKLNNTFLACRKNVLRLIDNCWLFFFIGSLFAAFFYRLLLIFLGHRLLVFLHKSPRFSSHFIMCVQFSLARLYPLNVCARPCRSACEMSCELTKRDLSQHTRS